MVVRLLICCVAIATGCYRPSAHAGAACGADRACPDPLLCRASTMTCEASDDTSIDAPDVDTGSPLDTHLQASPGWSIHVLVDLTGVVPYNANDFTDGLTIKETLDNAPNGLSALYAPFTASLAVAAGRSIIEVDGSGATTVHDYRPAVPDMLGPDGIYRLGFGAPTDTGPRLWLAAPSLNGGDGLYAVDSTWAIKRDDVNNNVTGVSFDPTGTFDTRNTGTLYFIDQAGIERRDTPSTFTNILVGSSDYDDLVITPSAIFAVHDPETPPCALTRVATGTHATTIVATATVLDIAEGGDVTLTSVTALQDQTELLVFAADGTSEIGARSTDPDWHWINASLARAPHPLAGSIVVLESNRALDIDRLLLVTPP